MALPRGSRLLALVNGAAGDGNAQALIDEAVATVFAPAGIEVEQVPTTHLGHARDHVAGLGEALYDFDGLLIVSGDGLIAEVIQGLSVSQRHPTHCFSAVLRPFSAVFPPFFCAVWLPGAETERTGEK